MFGTPSGFRRVTYVIPGGNSPLTRPVGDDVAARFCEAHHRPHGLLEMTPAFFRGWRQIALIGGLVALVVAILVAVDLPAFARLLGRADWYRLLPALLLTAVSYACVSAALVALFGPMGVAVPRRPMMRIAVLSVAVNNVVSFGGVAGYSLRAALSRPHGVATGRSLAISLTHAYLNNLFMFVLLAVGVVVLLGDPATAGAWRHTLKVVAVLVIAFLLLSTAALFSGVVRRVILRGIAGLMSVFPARWHPATRAALDELDQALGRAAEALGRSPGAMVWPLAFLGIHWCAMVGVFWCCLSAVAAPVDAAVVIGGFSVSVVAGFASLLPGGLGVQDASLTAVLALQGVPVEDAVLGALLFRFVYYVTPFLVTLPVYAPFLRGRGGGTGVEV